MLGTALFLSLSFVLRATFDEGFVEPLLTFFFDFYFKYSVTALQLVTENRHSKDFLCI